MAAFYKDATESCPKCATRNLRVMGYVHGRNTIALRCSNCGYYEDRQPADSSPDITNGLR